MDNLPIFYLSFLILLLGGAGVLIIRQIFKTRKTESRLSELEKKLKKETGTPQEYYELGSIYLQKKVFTLAISLLQKALKGNPELENLALVYNALGYAHFCVEQYDIAIRNYKEAIKACPDYVIAYNNLGNAYEKKKLTTQALASYLQALEYDPDNAIAKKRVERLRKILGQ